MPNSNIADYPARQMQRMEAIPYIAPEEIEMISNDQRYIHAGRFRFLIGFLNVITMFAIRKETTFPITSASSGEAKNGPKETCDPKKRQQTRHTLSSHVAFPASLTVQ